MPKFGPGTLKLGETGAEIDCSCLVNSFTIAMTKDQGDDTTKLCGTVKPGAITYTYAATGNLDIDTDDPAGIFFLSQTNPGSPQTAFHLHPVDRGRHVLHRDPDPGPDGLRVRHVRRGPDVRRRMGAHRETDLHPRDRRRRDVEPVRPVGPQRPRREVRRRTEGPRGCLNRPSRSKAPASSAPR